MKHCVMITGGASGTGYGIAQRFAKEGWAVILSSRSKEKAEIAAQSLMNEYHIQAVGVELNPDQPAQIDQAFEELGEMIPESLILNAANLADKLHFNYDPLTCDIMLWSEVIQTNIIWNFMIARKAAAYMKKDLKGSIVFISSNTSRRAIKGRTAYIASKGGINALSRALAIDLGEFGIRVNALLPGAIATERWAQYPEEFRKQKTDCAPLKKIADYDAIANAAWYLATDESLHTTGIELIVDDGMDAQLRSN